MKKPAFTLSLLAGLGLCALVGSVSACTSKEKKEADATQVVSPDTASKAEVAVSEDSVDTEQQQREEASRKFCEQFSLDNLMVLLHGEDGVTPAQKTGLTLIYSDEIEDEEEEGMSYSEAVYGRDIEKTTKRKLGYDIKATTGHSCFYQINMDTSTNPRLCFGNEDDAKGFFERASEQKTVKYGDQTLYIHKRPDKQELYLEKPYAGDDFETVYVLYPPELEDGFYTIRVEVYV